MASPNERGGDWVSWACKTLALRISHESESLRPRPGLAATHWRDEPSPGFGSGLRPHGARHACRSPRDPEKRRPLRPTERRGLTGEDRAGAEPVTIVSKPLADRLVPGGDVIGRTLMFGADPKSRQALTIVGVTADSSRADEHHARAVAVAAGPASGGELERGRGRRRHEQRGARDADCAQRCRFPSLESCLPVTSAAGFTPRPGRISAGAAVGRPARRDLSATGTTRRLPF